jgi:hypothetical protein
MEIVNDPDTIINKLYQARQWIYWDSEWQWVTLCSICFQLGIRLG